jgi:hypothetical protein
MACTALSSKKPERMPGFAPDGYNDLRQRTIPTVRRIITGILSAVSAFLALCLLVIGLDGIEVSLWAVWTACGIIIGCVVSALVVLLSRIDGKPIETEPEHVLGDEQHLPATNRALRRAEPPAAADDVIEKGEPWRWRPR